MRAQREVKEGSSFDKTPKAEAEVYYTDDEG